MFIVLIYGLHKVGLTVTLTKRPIEANLNQHFSPCLALIQSLIRTQASKLFGCQSERTRTK